MKKGELRTDLMVFERLKNDEYKFNINKAHELCITLGITNEVVYCSYIFCFEELERVSYQEVKSYNRLLNPEYYESIQELKGQLINNSKIITFPKRFN